MFGEFAGKHVGDQIRGSGFSHDGFTSNLFVFWVVGMTTEFFAFQETKTKTRAKRNLESFLFGL